MKNTKLVKMAQMAILAAIILVMAFTPLGYIRTGGLEITLITVPVIIGAIVMGPAYGAVLGGIFGITSFIQCFGMSPFGAVLLGINPFYTFIVCFVPRVLMGYLTGLLFKGLKKVDKTKWISYGATGLLGALMNTVFFMGALLLFFGRTEYILNLQQSMNASNILLFVVAFVGVNGAVEAAASCVVGAAVSKALDVFLKRSKV